MKKLMTFFALISIIILAIPINCYSWGPGSERSVILEKSDPFFDYLFANSPSSRGPLFNQYGAYRNIPTGVFQAYDYARHYGSNQPYNYNYGWNQPYSYGWNQPYSYGWNQPYNYDYDDGLESYRADTYDSDDSDLRQNLPYNYGPGTFPRWDYLPYSNPGYYIFDIEEPHLW